MLGLGVLALAPWKAVLVRRARRITPVGVVLIVVVVLCLVGGFVQLLLGWVPVLGVSAIQVHVGAALVGVPLLAWHVLRHRSQRFRRTDVSRRTLLRGATTVAGVAAGQALLGVVAEVSGGPWRRPAPTGSRPVDAATRPATIWLFDRVPTIGAAGFRVQVAGTPWTVGEHADDAGTVRARLDCTSGWYADAEWTGRRLWT